jgi:DNA-binding transcriptional LysR family regulator
MDKLEAMELLLEAADAGSLSAAGRRRRMPLATISRKIAELEAHLGTRLFTRSGRRLTLTDAGKAYSLASRRILDEVATADRAAAGEYEEPKGALVVTAPIVFGRLHLLPIAVAFLRAYPAITMQLSFSDRIVDIVEDHIDLAVRIGSLPDSSLVATRVGTIHRVVCASPGYLDARGVPATPEALVEHDCISFDTGPTQGRWFFRENGKDIELAPKPRLAVNTAEAAIDAAVAGLGLTQVLSYQSAPARLAGRLAPVLEAYARAPVPVSLVHGGARLLPRKVRAFLDYATPRLRSALA